MKRFLHAGLALLIAIQLFGCGYSFTGTNIDPAVQTYQVNFFQNRAQLIEPGIDRDFTLALQDLIQNQTRLDLVNVNGDLVYDGEITRYFIAPMTSTANNTAQENRLTIDINLRFTNTVTPDEDFERRYSFYFDYPGNQQLVGGALDTAIEFIYERITQDMFNDTLARW